KTAQLLGEDASSYLSLIKPLVQNWPKIASDTLGPLSIPKHPFAMGRFGLSALMPATSLAKLHFKTQEARGLWAGMAAHSIQPLSNVATSAIGLVLMAMGHINGWPIPKGGSSGIAKALASYFVSI